MHLKQQQNRGQEEVLAFRGESSSLSNRILCEEQWLSNTECPLVAILKHASFKKTQYLFIAYPLSCYPKVIIVTTHAHQS